MKIAWLIANPPQQAWSYFVQIRLFTKYLNRHSHTADVINFSDHLNDSQAILTSINQIKPDLLITIGDIHISHLPDYTNIPTLSIVTNGTGIINLPPIRPQNTSYAASSRFALSLLENRSIQASYLPHGFDPEIFHPDSQRRARKSLNLPQDPPLILMLGTNYPTSPHDLTPNALIDRKNWLGGLTAFKLLLKHRPDALLYLHTNSIGAVDLPTHIHRLKLSKSVILADTSKTGDITVNNQPQSHLATLYQAADVFLMPSLGESFGVPLIEAQACGAPVVTTASGPMTELVKTGTAVTAIHQYTFPGWGAPRPDDITKALLQCLQPQNRTVIANKIRNYRADFITNKYFLPIINESLDAHR